MKNPFITYLELFKNPTLGRSLIAYFVSETGDGFTSVALPLFILAQTGSAELVGVTFAINLTAASIAALLGGPIIDKLDRRFLVISSFIGRGLFLAVAATFPSVPVVMVVAAFAGMLGAVDNPAMEASILENSRDNVERTSAIRNLGYAGATAIGPALAGVTVALLGAQAAFFIDSLTFFAAAVLIFATPGYDPYSRIRRARVLAKGRSQSKFRQITSGFELIYQNRAVRGYISYSALEMIVVGIVLVALPVYMVQDANLGDSSYGFATGAYALGMALSLFYYGRKKFTRPYATLLISGLLFGVAAVGVGLFPLTIAIILFRIIWGWAYGPEQIVGDVLLVTHTGSEALGRVYAAFGVLIRIGAVLGSLIAGIIVSRVGAQTSIVVSGVLFTLLSLIFFARSAFKEHRKSKTKFPNPSTSEAS